MTPKPRPIPANRNSAPTRPAPRDDDTIIRLDLRRRMIRPLRGLSSTHVLATRGLTA